MTCHGGAVEAIIAGDNIILVGNHNVGKSVIFGWLTGQYVTVANYPGTTVEIARGTARGSKRGVIDTPGVNSLQPISDDERVTRDVILNESTHAVVQVADAKNLRRALLITSQLAETRLPLVMALNMMDEARARGICVDAHKLSALIGAPVVPTTATKREGLDALALAVDPAGDNEFGMPQPTHPLVRYDSRLEAGIDAVATELGGLNCDARGLAVMFMGGDETIDGWLRARIEPARFAHIDELRLALQTVMPATLPSMIQDARIQWVDATVRQVYESDHQQHQTLASRFGRLSVHPVWGLPILLGVLTLMYYFVGVFGAGVLVGFVEHTVFGEWVNPLVTNFVMTWVPIPIVQAFLVGPYGVITVALTYGFAIILPIVFTFFIAFGVLEDSGYLPRLAVMADRIFKTMGLNGKAVLPMVLGLGCDTMATMTTRTLESKKDRVLVTLLLALGVPCSAQLGVVLGMLAGLDARAALIWTGSVVGVMLAVGWLAAKVIPGETSDFILELPPIRMPKVGPLLVKTLARLEWYLKEVLPLFVLGTVILFVLDQLGMLAWLEIAMRPLIVDWLGLPAQATESFLIGFLRRDYGAAGFFLMAQQGLLTPNQIIVALVTITLFVPCIANVFVMVKERGWRTALAITAFVFPFAFGVGGVLNMLLKAMG